MTLSDGSQFSEAFQLSLRREYCKSVRLPVPRFKCPFCGATVPNEYHAGQPLACSGCGEKLQPSNRFLRFAFVTALALTLIVSVALGFRGWHLLAACALLLVPINFVWMFIYVRVVPPRFDRYLSPEEKDSRGKDKAW